MEMTASVAKHFNSQPHKEADNGLTYSVQKGIIISTHSLTRRLTCPTNHLRRTHGYFNSQPHKEADITGRGQLYFVNISTHSLTRRLTCLPFHVSK